MIKVLSYQSLIALKDQARQDYLKVNKKLSHLSYLFMWALYLSLTYTYLSYRKISKKSEGKKEEMVSSPIIDHLKNQLPLEQECLDLSENLRYGLVLVDIINGFCTVGAGPLVIIWLYFDSLSISYTPSVFFCCSYLDFFGVRKLVEVERIFESEGSTILSWTYKNWILYFPGSCRT